VHSATRPENFLSDSGDLCIFIFVHHVRHKMILLARLMLFFYSIRLMCHFVECLCNVFYPNLLSVCNSSDIYIYIM
jgi:hypothetical protein